MFTGCVNSRKMRVPLSPWCIFIDSANDKGSVGRMLVSHSPFGSTQSSQLTGTDFGRTSHKAKPSSL